MSWQGYVDNLMGTKNMSHVGIFGLDGVAWASSANFPVRKKSILLSFDRLSSQPQPFNYFIWFSLLAFCRQHSTYDRGCFRYEQSIGRLDSQRREVHSCSKRPRSNAHTQKGTKRPSCLQIGTM